ncbi:baseplate hub protein [Pseudescherichia sp.]|uniref:baseplate hub protein n=1 Tax=Pseudescherichia sp. TaxID=2055881 RepID=UPI002897E11C|nr:hypothetical protein [Pseudescherichia sp.]
MAQNWMRHFELQLADKDGEWIDFSEFKVFFTCNWYNSSMPRTAEVKIYNLKAETVSRIAGKAFTRIRIVAGYDGIAPDVAASSVGQAREVNAAAVGQSDGRNYGMIFSGEISATQTGREEKETLSTWVQIKATDSDKALITTTTARTLSAGYTPEDIDRLLMKDFSVDGITEGLKPKMPTTVYPRGRVLFGMTRHLMDNLAAQCTATWQFVDGKRQMIADHEYVHEAILLSSTTGLIGSPTAIDDGIKVKMLINPNIRMMGLVQLDQHIPFPAVPNGVYSVREILYTGDTRGQQWYMEMVCRPPGVEDPSPKATPPNSA